MDPDQKKKALAEAKKMMDELWDSGTSEHPSGASVILRPPVSLNLIQDVPYSRWTDIFGVADKDNNRQMFAMRTKNLDNKPVLDKLGISHLQLMRMTPKELEQRIERIAVIDPRILRFFIQPVTLDQNGNAGIDYTKFHDAEQQVIGAIMQPSPLPLHVLPPQQLSALPAATFNLHLPLPENPLVKIDPESASCLYHNDLLMGPQHPLQGIHYAPQHLLCLTPSGMIQFAHLDRSDYSVISGVLSLNLLRIKHVVCRLTDQSPRDQDKRIEMLGMSRPFIDEQTEPFHFYVPSNQQNVVVEIMYQTNLFKMLVANVAASQLPSFIRVDPHAMTYKFATDLRNVHFFDENTARLRKENTVYARVHCDQFTDPLCATLERLLYLVPDSNDPESKNLRVPYLYKINMRSLTCQKSLMHADRMMANGIDDSLPLMSEALYDSLNVENSLIDYMIFQMMFTYGKKNFEELMSITDDYMMVFDFYLRRSQSQHGFHYDTSKGFEVSTFGLLYHMPPGSIKVGPHVMALPFSGRAPLMTVRASNCGGFPASLPIVNTRYKPITPFVQNKTIVLFDNTVGAHSTPNMGAFLNRGDCLEHYHHPMMHADSAAVDVTFPDMGMPPLLVEQLQQSSLGPRAFVRSWRVLQLYAGQQSSQDEWSQPMNHEMFQSKAQECALKFHGWLEQEPCQHMQVDVQSGSYPSDLPPGHFGGNGKHNHLMRPTRHRDIVKRMSLSTSLNLKSKPTIRASTISNAREYIRTKLKKIKTIFENPNKNLIIMFSPQKAGSRSHSQSRNNKYKRTVRKRSSV